MHVGQEKCYVIFMLHYTWYYFWDEVSHHFVITCVAYIFISLFLYGFAMMSVVTRRAEMCKSRKTCKFCDIFQT